MDAIEEQSDTIRVSSLPSIINDQKEGKGRVEVSPYLKVYLMGTYMYISSAWQLQKWAASDLKVEVSLLPLCSVAIS